MKEAVLWTPFLDGETEVSRGERVAQSHTDSKWLHRDLTSDISEAEPGLLVNTNDGSSAWPIRARGWFLVTCQADFAIDIIPSFHSAVWSGI